MSETITLQEITAETVISICRLSETLSEPQRNMVAPNAVSLAQALFSPTAWYRAVCCDDTPVGFIMTDTDCEDGVPEVFLWRFMIAGPYQGRGFGKTALSILMADLKRQGFGELVTSCGQGEGSPRGFYEKLGFAANGKMLDDEVVLVRAL